jgi:hypothetical protein
MHAGKICFTYNIIKINLEVSVSFATIIRFAHVNTGKVEQLPKLLKENYLMLLRISQAVLVIIEYRILLQRQIKFTLSKTNKIKLGVLLLLLLLLFLLYFAPILVKHNC